MSKNRIYLSRLSKIMNRQMIGKDLLIAHLNLCNRKIIHPGTLTYVNSKNFIKYIENQKNFSGIIVSEEIYEDSKNVFNDISCILSNTPQDDFYAIHEYLVNENGFYDLFNFSSKIGSNIHLGKNVDIESDGVIIGNNVQIGSNTVITKGSVIGDNCIICSNVKIGCEGFQLIRDKFGNNQLIAHVGGVRISNDVFIGNGTVISKCLFEEFTIVGFGTKIGNLVNISHNCDIGNNCVITAGAILSGSVTIEDNVWVSPNATITNKIICKKNSFVGIGSVVLNDIEENYKVFGNPSRKIPL